MFEDQEGSIEDNQSSMSVPVTVISTHSRATSVGGPDDSDGLNGRPQGSRRSSRSKYDSNRPTAAGTAAQKFFAAASVLKAKKKWLGLLKSSSSRGSSSTSHLRLDDDSKPVFSSSTPQIMTSKPSAPPMVRDTFFALGLGRSQIPVISS